MKTDIDQLMVENGIEALWVVGSAAHNPNMVYFTGLHHISRADLIKKVGHSPVLFHDAMERDEATRTGLETRSLGYFSTTKFTEYSQKMFMDQGINQGRVLISGQADAGVIFATMTSLQKVMPGIEITGALQSDVLKSARLTKDADEIERIHRVGKLTVEVVGLTADYLSQQKEKDGILFDLEDKPITIGDVKRKIHLWLAERDLETPEETIFSIGRDAGIPHSAGTSTDVIRTGVPIVFDIFPCEGGGGYFYDFTRTWCVGHAPDQVWQLHEQVRKVYTTIVAELKINMRFLDCQLRTCELFSQMGHATVADQPGIEEGYVHSVGHGLGLAVHERPFSGMDAQTSDILEPGVIFTLEPGLYYPSRAMGVRLEDSLVVRENGQFEVLEPYPMDLIIPLKK